MSGFIGKAVGQKATGKQPSVVQAAGAAVVAGAAMAVLTYKLLRS